MRRCKNKTLKKLKYNFIESIVSRIDKMDKKRELCELANCKTKLRLTDWSCRCKKRFCAQHRPHEFHNCDYDFKNRLANDVNKMRCVKSKIDVI